MIHFMFVSVVFSLSLSCFLFSAPEDLSQESKHRFYQAARRDRSGESIRGDLCGHRGANIQWPISMSSSVVHIACGCLSWQRIIGRRGTTTCRPKCLGVSEDHDQKIRRKKIRINVWNAKSERTSKTTTTQLRKLTDKLLSSTRLALPSSPPTSNS